MFDTVNWPNVTIGAGFAIGLALVVAQLAARGQLITLLAYVAVRRAALGSAHLERAVTERAGGDADKLELVERVRTISGLRMNAVNVRRHQDPHQDPSTQAVDGRPRAAPAYQASIRRRRHRDPVPASIGPFWRGEQGVSDTLARRARRF